MNKKQKKAARKTAEKVAKKHPILVAVIILLVVAIAAAAVVVYFVKPEIYHKLLGVGEHGWGEWKVTAQADCGNDGKRERACTVCGEKESEVIPATGLHNFENGVCTVCHKPDSTGVISEISSADLSIHFLQLGNKYTGDCTLIKCGDVEVLIDAGSREDSATTILDYVDDYCTDGVIEYVIATHAHQDHISGFVGKSDDSESGMSGVLYNIRVGTLIQFAKTDATSTIYNRYNTAVNYAESEYGTKVYTALQCINGEEGAQKEYFLDGANSVKMTILDNYYYTHESSESIGGENNYSVCMLLSQTVGGKTLNYLFTGDLEKKGEEYLVRMNDLPEVELFKGAHHGSYTASSDALLQVIKPKRVAVCCCCGTTEFHPSAGHEFPAQEFCDRVAKYTDEVYCTSLIVDYSENKFEPLNGNIVFYYKDAIKLWCSNGTTKLKDTEWFKANREWNP